MFAQPRRGDAERHVPAIALDRRQTSVQPTAAEQIDRIAPAVQALEMGFDPEITRCGSRRFPIGPQHPIRLNRLDLIGCQVANAQTRRIEFQFLDSCRLKDLHSRLPRRIEQDMVHRYARHAPHLPGKLDLVIGATTMNCRTRHLRGPTASNPLQQPDSPQRLDPEPAEALAADFVAGEAMLFDKRYLPSAAGEQHRRDTSGWAGADHANLGHGADSKGRQLFSSRQNVPIRPSSRPELLPSQVTRDSVTFFGSGRISKQICFFSKNGHGLCRYAPRDPP
jgi:hypothetical protein